MAEEKKTPAAEEKASAAEKETAKKTVDKKRNSSQGYRG